MTQEQEGQQDNADELWQEIDLTMLSTPGTLPAATPASLALVLTARSIPCRLLTEQPPRLLVLARDHAVARRELGLYLRENIPSPPMPDIDGDYDNGRITISVLLLIGIFHNLTYLPISGPGGTLLNWVERGNAEAGRIVDGQWWRAVTALTLHADTIHLAGNLLIGGYFVYRLCRKLGGGVGWTLILWSGITGNLVNALLQSPLHRSVGASTALFGAIGAAGMIGVVRRQRSAARQWLLPLAGAAGLLAMLGAGDGEGLTDIGAHLFGFLCGLVLGHFAGKLIVRYGLPGPRLNKLLGLSSIGVVVLAWTFALIN